MNKKERLFVNRCGFKLSVRFISPIIYAKISELFRIFLSLSFISCFGEKVAKKGMSPLFFLRLLIDCCIIFPSK